jgi:hypothetical protein
MCQPYALPSEIDSPVNESWDFIQLFDIESNARCFLATVLRNYFIETLLSPSNSSDLEAIVDEAVSHGSADTTGSTNKQDVFVGERHLDMLCEVRSYGAVMMVIKVWRVHLLYAYYSFHIISDRPQTPFLNTI